VPNFGLLSDFDVIRKKTLLGGKLLMRFKVIACVLAVALLSVVAYGGENYNEKKREK
jgi:hypothetical protein